MAKANTNSDKDQSQNAQTGPNGNESAPNTASTSNKPLQEQSKRPPIELPPLEDFLKAGAHFGHKTSRWHPKMAQYIYDQRNGVHIIDLVKTMKLLKAALELVQEGSDRGSILIVGTKGQAATLVQNLSKEVGAFYVSNRWPGGLFTNFPMIKKSISNLIEMEETLAAGAPGMVKKEQLMLAREVDKLNRMYEGIKFMEQLPEIVIVIDSRVERIAIKEANAAGVKTVALIDTNSDPDLVSYAIPANDDSIKSITLFMTVFAKAVKGGKRSESVIALRNSHIAKLESLRSHYEQEQARLQAMEEAERERMKRLRAGEQVPAIETEAGTFIRVVKKADRTDIVPPGPKTEDAQKDTTTSSAETISSQITDLNINNRVQKVLQEAGYQNVGQLVGMSAVELTSIKGVGPKAAEEILEALSQQ